MCGVDRLGNSSAANPFSVTRYGRIDPNAPVKDERTHEMKNKSNWRLVNQKGYSASSREKSFLFCKRCAVLRAMVNYEALPSARLGIMGKCKGGDYRSHRWVKLSEAEYHQIKALPVDERQSHFYFDRD